MLRTNPIGTGLLLRRAQRSLARGINAQFSPYNISLAGFNVLFVLWREDGASQAGLPKHVDVDKATLTPIIDALEREGLIERRQDGADRRRNKLYLTARGRALEKPLKQIAADEVAAALRGVSAEQIAVMRHCLLTMMENLGETV